MPLSFTNIRSSALQNKANPSMYGPVLPSNPFSLTKQQPLRLGSTVGTSTQTSTQALPSSTSKYGGIGSGTGIGGFLTGALNSIKNPSQGSGLFQGIGSAKSSAAPMQPQPTKVGAVSPTGLSPQINAQTAQSNQPNSPTGSYSTTSTGQLIPVLPGNQTPVPPNANPIQNTSVYNTATNALGDQTNSGFNQQTGTAIKGLQNLSQSQSPEVLKQEEVYNKFAQQNPYMLAAQHNPNVAADVASGRSALLGQTFAAEQAAKAQAVQNALTGQGQQITAGTNAGNLAQTGQANQQSALTNAATLTKPEANAPYFGSPETGNVVGTGGVGQTGNSLIDNAVSNAVGLIRSGGSTQDAMATLNSLGQPAQQAFISQMRRFDPNWNPTSSNAIAQQNMTQGQQFQGQATQLSTTLKQLDLLQPTVLNFLKNSGINSMDVPLYNAGTQTYIGSLQNPANLASFNGYMADVKTYMAQILGSSGLNPTEVSSTVNSFDPKLLNGNQLKSLLENLKNLGQIRLQPLQQTASGSYGNTGGFMGAQANPSTQSSVATNSSSVAGSNIQNPVLQALVGGGINALGGLEGAVKGITGWAAAILK